MTLLQHLQEAVTHVMLHHLMFSLRAGVHHVLPTISLKAQIRWDVMHYYTSLFLHLANVS
jgi:hypothetical protein